MLVGDEACLDDTVKMYPMNDVQQIAMNKQLRLPMAPLSRSSLYSPKESKVAKKLYNMP